MSQALSFSQWALGAGPAVQRPVVEIRAAGRAVALSARQHLHLRQAKGMTVEVLKGLVWITQETDVRDTFVRAGERFVLDRDGDALLAAETESRLCLKPAAAGSGLRGSRP